MPILPLLVATQIAVMTKLRFVFCQSIDIERYDLLYFILKVEIEWQNARLQQSYRNQLFLVVGQVFEWRKDADGHNDVGPKWSSVQHHNTPSQRNSTP